MFLLFLIVALALSISFICSILEAGFLSVQVPRLLERQDSGGSKGITLFLELKQHKVDDAISAILTLNTISNTIGAALAGAQAVALWGDHWIGLFSAALTMLILIFSEIIPKTLGAVYAMKLAPAVGSLTFLLTLVMKPILAFTRLITKLIVRKENEFVTRGEISAMVALAASQGAISPLQSRLLSNFLEFESLNLGHVMTPRPVLTAMPQRATVAEMLANDAVKSFSRIPVYGKNLDDIKGYVIVRQVWASIAMGGDRDQALSSFRRPISVLPKTYSLGKALRTLIKRSEHLAVVLDEYGGVSGLVTLEDLIETILGVEITDELDRVVDLRSAAEKIRDQRLERMNRPNNDQG